MSRRRETPVRPVDPDPRYSSKVVTKFVNRMMIQGKKSVSFSNVYGAMDFIGKKAEKGCTRCFPESC